MEPRLSITLASDLVEIRRAQAHVEEFGAVHGVPVAVVHTFNLCLEEIVSNVIRHGYAGREADKVELCVQIRERAMIMEVTDRGKPFNPLEKPAPDTSLPLEERQIGGLGIHLVRNMMDDLEYRREGDANVLVMKKRL